MKMVESERGRKGGKEERGEKKRGREYAIEPQC